MTKCPQVKLLLVISLLICMVGCGGAALRVPARDFLYRGQKAEAGLGAYGYVVFAAQPDSAQRTRYELICGSFNRNLPARSDYEGREKSTVMVTYWLLTKEVEPVCNKLVDNYDYAEGNAIASSLGRSSRSGPLLVAWTTPYDGSQTTADALMLDMSDFSNEDLDRAVGIWKEQITKDPSVWNNGFNLIKAREAFRNLISRYGTDIISIIKPK